MEMDRVMGERAGDHFFREGNGSDYVWKSWKPKVSVYTNMNMALEGSLAPFSAELVPYLFIGDGNGSG